MILTLPLIATSVFKERLNPLLNCTLVYKVPSFNVFTLVDSAISALQKALVIS